MDFSGLSSAEQAHVNKLVEKRQVFALHTPTALTELGVISSKASSPCMANLSRNVSTHVAMISPASPCLQKKCVSARWIKPRINITAGAMREQLRRKIHEAFRTC
jgi:hypothetical protein